MHNIVSLLKTLFILTGKINSNLMMLVEHLKLLHRAKKYQYKDDRGGIFYIKRVIKKGDTVFDVGAHKAGYLYFMQKLTGKDGTAIAFEPQPDLFQYLKTLKLRFNWNNTIIENLALSDTAGDASLFIPVNKLHKSSAPGATLVKYPGQHNISAIKKVAVETIDTYCDKTKSAPSLIKIDVEGNELKTICGGARVLAKYKPKLLVEIEERQAGKALVLETFGYLKGLGYSGYFFEGTKLIELRHFSFEKHQNASDPENYCNNFVFESNGR
jgi:FkbM family methyltransferase